MNTTPSFELCRGLNTISLMLLRTGVNFAIQCQRFIELVRGSQLEEAVQFAQEHLGLLRRKDHSRDPELQHVRK